MHSAPDHSPPCVCVCGSEQAANRPMAKSWKFKIVLRTTFFELLNANIEYSQSLQALQAVETERVRSKVQSSEQARCSSLKRRTIFSLFSSFALSYATKQARASLFARQRTWKFKIFGQEIEI